MSFRSLRSALQSLSDKSLKTSRRLDNTYYRILEKVSVLHQTIGMLQELSVLTKELHTNFEADAKELVEDIKGQFEGFDKFEAQQKQVTALEERIKTGKEKADALTRRLADAKEKVDKRAEAEAQSGARMTRKIVATLYGKMVPTNIKHRTTTHPLGYTSLHHGCRSCLDPLSPFEAPSHI